MIWKILKSSHFKLLIKCFQAIVIKLQREKFFKVALLSYKKMALLALFKTNHTGPSSTGSLGLHQISADIGSPVCSLPKSWDINKRNLFPQITLGTTDSKQHTISVANLVFKKVSEKCHFELISGNFHEVLPDFLVFWKFYSNGVTETQNSDNAIEFSIKKYLYSQSFKKGTQKMPALVPHPTVSLSSLSRQ